jgi:beta-mannosidase
MKRATQWPLVLAALLVGCSPAEEQGQERIALNSGWQFREATDTIWHAAEVPGTIHTDLMRAGLLPDPYHSTYEDSVQWVEDRDWVYRLHWEAGEELLAKEQVDLVFKGLDTFVRITLNGQPLGEADNMFRTWRFPAKHLLRKGDNLIELYFRSVVREGAGRMNAYGRSLPADNDVGRVQVGPFVRKAGIHFGWDFAPRLVTCGIWQEVEAHAWNGARIDGVRVTGTRVGGMRELAVHLSLEGEPDPDAWLRVLFNDRLVAGPVPVLERTSRITIMVPDTGRWWPAGMGEQKLHELRVELGQGRQMADVWSGRIGLRDIALDQEPDEQGSPFRFLVNGEPLFAMGANLVPPDMFLPRAGDAAWVALVRDMQDCGMNMVRVWGGGVYPPDAFFDACDTAGILVWQDLMFGNTMLPDDPAFLQNVEAEVRGQVGRLQHHASLALWCGNNEIDVAWHNWGWQRSHNISVEDSLRMWHTYEDLFKRRFPRIMEELDPGRAYTHTSPLSNWGNSHGLRHGNLHYWGVWHGDEPFENFATNVGRFVSEYGFQSYPSWDLLVQWAAPGDLDRGTEFWKRRQKSYKGDAAIERMARHHGLSIRDRQEFIQRSRELQAMAYRMAIEAHRADPHCAGTLLWQLNDVWPGPSWSLIEYGGTRKPAFLAVKEAYAQP